MHFSTLFSIDFWIDFYENYRRLILAVGCTILVATAGSVYLYLTRAQQNELAQRALAEMLQEAVRAEQDAELWSEVEVAARTGHSQYQSTFFAPYFLSLQADALWHQGKIDDAINVMKTMLSLISKKSPLYSLYEIKQARMMLESNQEETRLQGLELLISLANNNENSQQDQALYYLGMHYINGGKKDAAKDSFQKLVAIFGGKKTADYRSPWLSMAQVILQQELA